MPRINLLPKNISELIAAGEVVERPASVVKELVENSIDSGASSVTVEIQRGGVSFIRVTDNGCGILHEDVPKAFLSHATSKVSKQSDLEAIFTLGFRGEALASICAVARVQLLSKSPDEETGTSYVIEGSQELQYEVSGCPDGTTVIVRDLFYNVPARMKFLKKDVSEGNAVSDILDRLALSHPEVSFRFIRDGKQIFLTPGDGKLISSVYSVFGAGFSSTLIEAEGEFEGARVSGLISRPIDSRGSRSMQFFYINGRYVRSRSLTASFENAYKNAVMVGKFPACVLNIEIPFDSVDVNVHPTKTEVRFSDERKILSAVYYAARSAIQAFDSRPSFDFGKVTAAPNETAPQLVFSQNAKREPAAPERSSVLNPSMQKAASFWVKTTAENFSHVSDVQSSSFSVDEEEPDLIGDLSSFRKTPAARDESAAPAAEPEIKTEDNASADILYIGEAFKTYIIVEFNGKLCMIDKHAAHERIIFNRLKEQRDAEASQVMLNPVVLTVSKAEYDMILANKVVFEKSGFAVEDFGDGAVAVRQRPMLIDDADVSDVVLEIAEALLLGRSDGFDERLDSALHTTACKAAIKAGNVNNPEELKKLAERVCFDDDVRYCPHGRPVMIEMSRYELEKQFRRIQS